jgi:hypothetical protein
VTNLDGAQSVDVDTAPEGLSAVLCPLCEVTVQWHELANRACEGRRDLWR